MQALIDCVLIIFGTQVIKKKRPVLPVFPDYLYVSYDYGCGEYFSVYGLLSNAQYIEFLVVYWIVGFVFIGNFYRYLFIHNFSIYIYTLITIIKNRS